jgi:hypothetical protein
MALSLEEIGKRMLEGARTGFARHPDGHKYHGFTCPECGRHEFGTSPLPNGVMVGHCHGHQHSGNGCTFKWDRKNAEDEKNVFYDMTREEWMASAMGIKKD